MARPVPRRYVRGPGVDDPIVVYDGGITTTKRWFYRNWQGSIIAEADASGSATAIYSWCCRGSRMPQVISREF